MRILIFGDVHGNLVALEKLFAFEKNSFDYFVSHGDVVNYGPWSNECVLFLEDRDNGSLLTGNHEKFFLNSNYEGDHPVANAFFRYCYPKFTESSTIAKYKSKCTLKDYNVQHTLFDKYIFEDTFLPNIDSNYIIGHSHYQFSRNVGQFELINTGSVGQNRKYINLIEYVVYDTTSGKVELKSIQYDVDVLINEMRIRNYPKICLEYYCSKKRVK